MDPNWRAIKGYLEYQEAQQKLEASHAQDEVGQSAALVWVAAVVLATLLYYRNSLSGMRNRIRRRGMTAEEQREEMAAKRLKAIEDHKKQIHTGGVLVTETHEDPHIPKDDTESSVMITEQDAMTTRLDNGLRKRNVPSEGQGKTKNHYQMGGIWDNDKLPEHSPSVLMAIDDTAMELSTPKELKENEYREASTPKKYKRNAPAAQMACDALSWIYDFSIRFDVERDEHSGSWGGASWWSSSLAQSLRPKKSLKIDAQNVTLPLRQKYDPDKEDDWRYLCQTLSILLLDTTTNHQLPPYQRIRGDESLHRLMIAYSRAEAIRNQRVSLFSVVESNFLEHFGPLLQALQQDMVQTILNRIGDQEDSISPLSMDLTIDNDDGLFSDDYDKASVPNAGQSGPPKTPWDAFVALVAAHDPSIAFDRLLHDMTQLRPSLANSLLSRILIEIEGTNNNHPGVDGWMSLLAAHTTLLVPAWLSTMPQELKLLQDDAWDGRHAEKKFFLSPLFKMAASTTESFDLLSSKPLASRWTKVLIQETENFPFKVFGKRRNEELHSTMKLFQDRALRARGIIDSWFKLALKQQRDVVFSWAEALVTKNLSLTSLAKSDLLDQEPGSKLTKCSTISMLLGVSSAWVQFCALSLAERFEKIGADAFDHAYLEDEAHQRLFDTSSQHALFGETQADTTVSSSSKKYSGSTHFFFLASSLLRISLYPVLKMYHESNQVNKQLFDIFQGQAQDPERQDGPAIPHRFLATASPKVAAWLGMKTFLEDPSFVSTATNFVLLQLKWVLRLSSQVQYPSMPDWMVKDPAKWLSEMALTVPHLLTPMQAQQAIECSTELLDIGSGKFSPIIVAALIRIAYAFVMAGVNRARYRQHRRRRGDVDDWDENVDYRDLEIYLSFEKNDLGVTVFTNNLVETRLCPSLVRTFRNLDVVEGLDMDQEYDFDKFSVKSQVAELLLRLWSHPNGKCRQSVVDEVKPSEWHSFASSWSAALSVSFDFGVEKVVTSLQTLKDRTTKRNPLLLEHHITSAASGIFGARRHLLLGCTLSQEKVVAAAMGGKEGDSNSVADLANMIVHFVDILTGEDGGTHKDLEYDLLSKNEKGVQGRNSKLPGRTLATVKEKLVESRLYGIRTFGLNVSVLCHQLFSLAASWHHAAKNGSRVSPFLMALARNDDLDVDRYRRVFDRLILPKFEDATKDDDSVLQNDGYRAAEEVAWARGEGKTKDPGKKRHQNTTFQDQMSHDQIEQMLGSSDRIQFFLDDLGTLVAREKAKKEKETVSDIAGAERTLLTNGGNLSEDDYEEKLSEWVVSSSPFTKTTDNTQFLHHYDNTARSRNSPGSAKSLVKEARRCHRTLPAPNANSSCFVCFAEERMDLCRAVISGPADTPYAYGLFVFDVYFPPAYPHVPPLVTFLTTGGGTVRFNPNLYVDGKVCLSLLGLTYAQDDTQRWNPESSSMAQVLLSMQTQILGVSEPYFNEGSGIPLSERNTQAGKKGSRQYNSGLRLATLRHAMVAHLRDPPVGMEVVTERHFAMCRRRILTQAKRWLVEEGEWNGVNSISYRRMDRAYKELVSLLLAKYRDDPTDSLELSPEDLEFLHKHDSSLEFPEDSKPKGKSVKANAVAATVPAAVVDPNNPWASPEALRQQGSTESGTSEDIDDELYM